MSETVIWVIGAIAVTSFFWAMFALHLHWLVKFESDAREHAESSAKGWGERVDELLVELRDEKADHERDIDDYVAGMTLMSALEAARKSGKPMRLKLTRTGYHFLGAPKIPSNVTLEWDGEAPNFYCVDREGVEVVKAVKA